MSATRLDVWPPLPPQAFVRGPRRALPFPLEEEECRLFARGRHALWQGLRLMALGSGDQVLAPAYHHGSEIEAMVRLGIGCRFYDATPSLAPDEAELEELIGPEVRALHLIHYLGFPQDALRWRRWCDERGLLLVEDAAQAWLASAGGRPIGSFGDIAIFSLYKTFGFGEGGALTSRRQLTAAPVASGMGVGLVARRTADWLASRSPLSARAVSLADREEPYDPAEDFALGDPDRPLSRGTLALLPRLADQHAAERRRLHYRILLEDLAGMVPPPYQALPEGASPFAFPIEVVPKEKMLRGLRHAGIAALDIWSVPHPTLPPDRFPGAAGRRASLIGLPVHQELRPRDLERISRVVRALSGAAGRREELETSTSLDAFAHVWDELAERSGNIFATRQWASTWWRYFGREGEPWIGLLRSKGGDGLALLPLYRWSARPLGVVRFIGHGPADQLGPVCDPSDRTAAARGLRRALAGAPWTWDAFLGDDMAGDEDWAGLLGATRLHRDESPVLRLTAADWETFLASRSSNFRQQLRRRERSLARSHDLRFRLANDGDRLDADLNVLFRLHGERWSVGSSQFAPFVAFHRAFARSAFDHGWLRLWFLELDGRPVAAWYGFRLGGVESYYQAGRTTSGVGSSVGLVLLAHTIREALTDGMAEYRFLRGGEGYKYRFTDEDRGIETIAFGRGVAGEAAVRAAALVGRGSAPWRMLRNLFPG